MITLNNLNNSDRPFRKVQRVGRGNGSKRGKTCCRGAKGDKARSGYKRRFGHEGGQLPLYRRLPTRGFGNGRFRSKVFAMNLADVEKLFSAGEVVSMKTILEKGIAGQAYTGGLKILSVGELKKKVTVEAEYISAAAQEKLKNSKIPFKILSAE